MASTRPPPHPSNFAGHDEHGDAVKFAHALHPPPTGLYTLQEACPAVTPQSSCIDVLLFQGVLLVAYAAADEVIIARGTDLQALKRLRGPQDNVTSLAFRKRDAAIVAAYGATIIVFEGWSDAARERGIVFDCNCKEVTLEAAEFGVTSPVVSLSWDETGTILCAVADCILVWSIQPDHLPVRFSLSVNIPSAETPTLPLALGALSPDGALLAVSGLYARIAYVWSLKQRHDGSRAVAEIVHGRTGISALDWKKRGGGNQALMTTDRDGTIRLWVKTLPSRSLYNDVKSGRASAPNSWMEEIARSPHVENTPRAGACFLDWGGGGGVADDEGDARATNAVHPLLAQGTAPKPSRCHHWVVCIAGGDARAWRVRGLDDRPRAEFTRMEPGTGDYLVGVQEDCEDELPQQLPLQDVSVAAMKAVAPIPLTTASTYKVGLVKSYAISNGERRLRSPEPPEPPNVVALFLLAVRNGVPFLARYDICPTAGVPAVCRARIGLGHMSPVMDLVTNSNQQSPSALLGSGGWLASQGRNGDVLLWRTTVSTGAWESLRTVAILPGPHTAVAFAPPLSTSSNRWEVGVLSCDSATASLRLFHFVNIVNRFENTAGQDVQFAKEVAVCNPRSRRASDTVIRLSAVSLFSAGFDLSGASVLAVFGLTRSGRLCVWSVTRRQRDATSIEPAVLRFAGGRHEVVTHLTSNELTSLGRHIIVVGGHDGSVFIYAVGQSEAAVESIADVRDSDDDEPDEGAMWLKELDRLEHSERNGDPVVKTEVVAGGLRILSLHRSGAAVVWARNPSESSAWEVELTIPGSPRSSDGSKAVGQCDQDSSLYQKASASIGYDREGNFSVIIQRADGSFECFRRILGQPWECIQRKQKPRNFVAGGAAIAYIGKGVFAAPVGRGISVIGTAKSDVSHLACTSDAAGYNPSKAIVAQLLTGGRAWQVSAALRELHDYVRRVTSRNASEASYAAGRGLIAPPPSLNVLLSSQIEPPSDTDANSSSPLTVEANENPFSLGGGQNLFMRLMAKTEVSNSGDNTSQEFGKSTADDLSSLARRLRIVSLAGLTRSEQSVLASIAEACASLKATLGSLDVCGARFALLAESHRLLSKNEHLPLSIVANAVHSSSRDALLDYFLPAPQPGQSSEGEKSKMWEAAKALGAGWWVSTTPECKMLAERIARADFAISKNPDDTALWYVVLGRTRALSALYRSQQNTRLAQFLLRDFRKPENQVAAKKNAYVLVSKHRLELAVSFFVLSGDITGALNLVKSRIQDYQLALLLSRILGEEKYVSGVLDFIVERCRDLGDGHGMAIGLWLSGSHERALEAASRAKLSRGNDSSGENKQLLAGSLPSVVHSLGHVLAMVDRPPVRGSGFSKQIVRECRRKAVLALLGDGSPVVALVCAFEIMKSEGDETSEHGARSCSKRTVDTARGSALIAAIDALKGRAVCQSGAVMSGASEESLHSMLVKDIKDLVSSPLGLETTITAAECAAFELVRDDEIDAAISSTYAALEVLDQEPLKQKVLRKRMHASQRNCLRVSVSRALFYVQGSLSVLHHPTLSSFRLAEIITRYKAALACVEAHNQGRGDTFSRLVLEFRGVILSLRFAHLFLKGDWPGILQALRTCELSWQPRDFLWDEHGADRDREDVNSNTSMCSSLAPESVSVEALRHVASNPAILRISKNLGHVRRYRKTPSMSMVGTSNGAAAAVSDDAFGAPTLVVSSEDPYAIIRMHPALSATLATSSLAYLAAHLAANAAAFAKFQSLECSPKTRGSQLYWQADSGLGYDQSFRLIKASETLEQLAEDAIAHWAPLRKFGTEADADSLAHPDDAAGAFVELWSTLGCLPEYAPGLSEAATVAAAEMAAAASRAVIEAAEQKEGGRRQRRKRERQGEIVSSAAKEGLKLFDTTSADSLYGAYPVRFSASAQGPWSGRGRNATLYSEDHALFRALCISATDPPAVVVATPKGIQEIVPSSYTTLPAGFRSHYASHRRQKGNESEDERLEALAVDRNYEDLIESREDEDHFLRSYDGFGEGAYVPLDMTTSDESVGRSLQRLSDPGGSGSGRKAVWRHQVHATKLASHPLRRRFASGGTDGVIRLWEFADPISLASFREEHYGRVADLCFSAYGNTMMAVYASGHVTVWDDPDVYSSHPRNRYRSRGSRAKNIRAFDNRSASGATFLDERHTIAVVGDPTAPPSVGHSLRIFDTREPNSSFAASWSAAVNHQFEARCVALLEDRMRVVSGGLDGSLSIVDLRTKACIAELPAHDEEVTCLALESPRGRALVSGSASGDVKLWDSRTLLQLDALPEAHIPTRHYWSGNGIGGLVGSYGTQSLALTDRSLISCGGDGKVKIWGPGWSDFDLNVL